MGDVECIEWWLAVASGRGQRSRFGATTSAKLAKSGFFSKSKWTDGIDVDKYVHLKWTDGVDVTKYVVLLPSPSALRPAEGVEDGLEHAGGEEAGMGGPA